MYIYTVYVKVFCQIIQIIQSLLILTLFQQKLFEENFRFNCVSFINNLHM